jgi:hypothetical protein
VTDHALPAAGVVRRALASALLWAISPLLQLVDDAETTAWDGDDE